MISKLCPQCGAKHPVDEKCPNGCEAKRKRKRDKDYDTHRRQNATVYHSKKWTTARAMSLASYNGICIYTLFKHQRVVPASLVHHIIEVSKDDDGALVYSQSNLIPVSTQAHAEIHKRYAKEELERVQEELREYKRAYARGVSTKF